MDHAERDGDEEQRRRTNTMGKTCYPVYPRSEFMMWTRTHAERFVDHAGAVGLSGARAEAYRELVAEVDRLILEQEEARNLYRTRTSTMEEGLARLLAATGSTVKTIRAFAESAEVPIDVYSAAQLPPPAKGSPAAAPAKPNSLTVTLRAGEGALEISWKARNPRGTQGTSYIVRRRLAGETQWSFIGVTGAKRFVDTGVPAGIASVQYTVQGQRADQSGAWSEVLDVQMGAENVRAGAAKLAA
jgi:hypothetical protein